MKPVLCILISASPLFAGEKALDDAAKPRVTTGTIEVPVAMRATDGHTYIDVQGVQVWKLDTGRKISSTAVTEGGERVVITLDRLGASGVDYHYETMLVAEIRDRTWFAAELKAMRASALARPDGCRREIDQIDQASMPDYPNLRLLTVENEKPDPPTKTNWKWIVWDVLTGVQATTPHSAKMD